MQNLGKFRALGAVLRDCSHIEVDFAVPLLSRIFPVSYVVKATTESLMLDQVISIGCLLILLSLSH